VLILSNLIKKSAQSTVLFCVLLFPAQILILKISLTQTAHGGNSYIYLLKKTDFYEKDECRCIG
jgi:hypothetical protein